MLARIAAAPSLSACWMPPACTPIDAVASACLLSGAGGVGVEGLVASVVLSLADGSLDFLQAVEPTKRPNTNAHVMERVIVPPFRRTMLTTQDWHGKVRRH